MKIEILKDNIFKTHYSAIIEEIADDEQEELLNVYMLINYIGYGETPLEALENLTHKLEAIHH